MSDKKTGAATAAPDSTEKVENPVIDQAVITDLKANTVKLETEIQELNTKVNELEVQNKELLESLKEAAEIISELKEKAGSSASNEVTITIDKKVYVVTKGCRDKNRTWLPEDIAADSKKAKELLEKGSTILQLKKK